MICDYVGLKAKIEMYFKEEITLQELGIWCEKAYYDTIRGQYLSLSSLLVYPLLKKLYRINVMPNDREDNWPCSLSEIDSVREILSGKRNAVFALTVGFPASVSSVYIKDYDKKKEQYEKLKTVLLNYLAAGKLEHDSAATVESIAGKEINRSVTVLDYIEKQIIACMTNIVVQDRQLKLINPLGLYCEKRESAEDMIKKAVGCIDCYTGSKNTGLQISYIDGIPELNAFIFD